MKQKYFSIIFAGIMLCSVFMTGNYINAADSKTEKKEFTLTAEADPENNCINLKWSRNNLNDNSEPYSYMLYSKENGKEGEYFQSIPCKEKVNVLNVYPTLGRNLKTWMKEPALEIANGDKYDVELTINKIIDRKAGDPKKYTDEKVKYNYIRDDEGNFITNGRGFIQADPNDISKPYKINDSYVYAKDKEGNERTELINVEDIDIDDFNRNSSKEINSLMDSNNKYKYDVVYTGGWDMNNKKSYSKESLNYINEYIYTGRGYLAGHDTSLSKNDVFNKYLMSTGSYGQAWYGDTTVNIKKKGLLTNYPWKIGEINESLTVPMSHTDQFTSGDVWFKYNHNNWGSCGEEVTSFNGKKGTGNFYLTTWNNTAMIQTGHSNGMATPDEQKILANTLFYLAQLTTDMSWSDHKGQDLASPNKPNIKDVNRKDDKIEVSLDESKDNGSTYNYYLKAIGQNTNKQITTEDSPATATITTGIDKYLVVMDDKENTNIEAKTTENIKNKKDIFEGIDVTNKADITYDKKVDGDFYVHVAAIDKAGNISETSTYYYANPTLNLEASPTEYTNGSVIITATANNPAFGISKISYEGTDLETTEVDNKTLKSTYEVTKNGDYTFTATDPKGNVVTSTITIDNIRPIILDVVPENKDAKLKDDVNVNLTINNITDVLEQTVLINYDSEKLYYTGFDKECDYFVLSARNIEPGKLLFKLKTNELNRKILNLHFTATDVGQAKVSVSNDSKLYLSDNSERSLLDIECGKTMINIK